MARLEPVERVSRSGATLVLRSAEADEAPLVIDYLNGVAGESDFLSFGRGEYYRSDEQQRVMLREHASQINQLYLLALHGHDIVGHISYSSSVRPRISRSGELGMAVRKDWWGQGLGETLMSALVQWAASCPEVRKINLRTRVDNLAAIRLYEKMEFEREGVIREDNFIGDQYFDTLWMGRIV